MRASGIYDVDTICDFVDKITSDIIGERFYNRDAGAKYLNQIAGDGKSFTNLAMDRLQGNRRQVYREFLAKRLDFLDSYFSADDDKTIIMLRSNASGVKKTLGITTHNSRYIALKSDQLFEQISFVDEDNTESTKFIVTV